MKNESPNNRFVSLKKLRLLGQRSWFFQVLVLMLLLLSGAGQAQAQTGRCYKSRELNHYLGTWLVKPGGTYLQNGDVIASTFASVQYFMPYAYGDSIVITAKGQSASNSYNAIPLVGMPGLGLVVRWGGYTPKDSVPAVGSGAPTGEIISNKSVVSVLEATSKIIQDFTVTLYYTLELVVIDASVYKGGLLSSVTPLSMEIVTASKHSLVGNSTAVCQGGALDIMGALTGVLQLPELPKPALPTCKLFLGSLGQQVPLGPVDRSQVVPFGSSRSLGTEGQAPFTIQATGCNKYAKMDIYFTDTRDGSISKNYLLSSNPAVGIRIFYRDEFDPIPFGPAPSGSWVPQRYAVSLGPATVEGESLTADFIAQYVRLPNKTAADVIAGPLEATAVFVVVYP